MFAAAALLGVTMPVISPLVAPAHAFECATWADPICRIVLGPVCRNRCL